MMDGTPGTMLLGWLAFSAAALSPGPDMIAVASRAPGASRRPALCTDDPFASWRQVLSGTFANRRWKFSVVASASVSSGMPRSSATNSAVCRTKAGSLVLPRWGTGAR